MKVWQFTEQSYYPAWEQVDGPTKITIPSSLCDPEIASQLYNRYLDEWMLADELGLDIMVNEHHASANCLTNSCNVILGILARQTKKARLLALGVPVTNRTDPLRVAEELAMIDVISRGRLEIGLIKASPNELTVSNQNPVGIMDRYWEAHDFIVKALTTHDGPFRWEGEYFNYRNVNVWPRPLQQPMPPMWITASGVQSGRKIAQLGYVCATFFDGGGAKILFQAYKDEYLKTHGKPAGLDRLGFMGMVVVGNTEAEAQDRASRLKPYLKYQGRAPKFSVNPPGYEGVEPNVQALRAQHKGMIAFSKLRLVDGRPLPAKPTDEEYALAGALFCGTPDQVFDQMKHFHDAVGGLGNFLMLGQGGYMTHEDTVGSLTLFAKEVYPRLKELKAPEQRGVLAAE